MLIDLFINLPVIVLILIEQVLIDLPGPIKLPEMVLVLIEVVLVELVPNEKTPIMSYRRRGGSLLGSQVKVTGGDGMNGNAQIGSSKSFFFDTKNRGSEAADADRDAADQNAAPASELSMVCCPRFAFVICLTQVLRSMDSIIASIVRLVT